MIDLKGPHLEFLELDTLGMNSTEQISNSSNFERWVEEIYLHSKECSSKLTPLEIPLHTGYSCDACASKYTIGSGILFKTMPEHYSWHMHSHEGRLQFVAPLTSGELLGSAPFLKTIAPRKTSSNF